MLQVIYPRVYVFSDIVPVTTVQLDIFWKEMDGDADWVCYW